MYQQLTTWGNLYHAWRGAARGKRGHPNVAAFEYALEENLLTLQRELRLQRYQPGQYVSFVIHEPKRRVISAAPFRDRVVHHALCNVIEPAFECSFITDSYANRVGKGTHRALNRCQQFMRRYRYVLAIDVRQIFPSIDHTILYEILCRKVSDEQVRWLIRRILASGIGVLAQAYDMVWYAGDNLFAAIRHRGLPIGNLTSQFWANCYMNPFDHFVKRELRCPAYVRYVDDMLLWSDSKSQLWAWKAAIEARLATLRLTIHAGAAPSPVKEGIGFLGFRVFPDARRLKNRKAFHYRRQLRKMITQYADGELTFAELTASVQGWVNHVRFGNTVGLRKAILTGQTIPAQRRKR